MTSAIYHGHKASNQIIIKVSIFMEDYVFSMTVNLPYGPPMNTDNDYYQTFFSDLFVSDAMLVVWYMLG